MPKSLAEIILDHASAEEFAALKLLLSKDEDKIAENTNSDLSFALHQIVVCGETDLAKKLISKIDLNTFSEKQNCEILLSVGNSRFVEVFNYMIDRGFNAGATSKGRDVFSVLTGQSVTKGHFQYEADYSMVEKLLETGEVQGFVDRKSIAEALSKLENEGPRAFIDLNRVIIENDSRVQKKPRLGEGGPSVTASLRPGSQAASKKENGWRCVVS